jgi:hypothetical protein
VLWGANEPDFPRELSIPLDVGLRGINSSRGKYRPAAHNGSPLRNREGLPTAQSVSQSGTQAESAESTPTEKAILAHHRRVRRVASTPMNPATIRNNEIASA